MKDTAGEVFTKEQLDKLAGRCKICKQLEVNGGGEEGPFWQVCNSDYRDDLAIWNDLWGYELPCPFFVTDLKYCAEHEEVTTSDIGCSGCLKEYIEDKTGVGGEYDG